MSQGQNQQRHGVTPFFACGYNARLPPITKNRSMSDSYLFTSESVSEGHPGQDFRPDFRRHLDAILARTRQGASRLRDHGQDRHGCGRRRSHDLGVGRYRRNRARPSSGYRLRRSGHGLRRPLLRRAERARQAVARYCAGRRSRQMPRTGRRRPGPDVWLRLQRDRRADAGADHLCASPGPPPGRSRKNGTLPWLRPDAKSQVTFVYEDNKPVGIDAVVCCRPSTTRTCQHGRPRAKASWKKSSSRSAGRMAQRADTQVSHQPDRSLRDRRPDGRLRPDRPQDHRRHLRRLCPSWRRRVLGQGPVEG